VTPYYERDGITIYHGDCRDVLPLLGPVDLVVTSPPYNCRKAYPSGDEWAWDDYYTWMETVLQSLYRLLTKGGTLALNVPGVIRWQHDHQYASSWSDFDPDYHSHRHGERFIGKGRVEPLGFRLLAMMQALDPHIREPIVWIKGSNGNAISSDYRMGCDSDPYMRPAHEFILLGSKGRWFHRGGTGRRGREAVPFLDETKDVWFLPPVSNDDHPATFPLELPRRLIRLFTHAADALVLDPFMGSGTTLRAAKDLGRRAIGIEIEEKYCEIAVKRLAQEVLAL